MGNLHRIPRTNISVSSQSCSHSEFASKELHAEVSNHTRQWPPACQCDHASAPRPTPRICENQGVLGSCVDSTWNVRTGNSSQLTSSYNGTYLLQVQTPTISNFHNFHSRLLQALQRIIFMSHIDCLGSCSISAYFYWLFVPK